MKKSTLNATLENNIVFWLNSLFPSPPGAHDYYRFFSDVSMRVMIDCVTELVKKGIVAESALRYEDNEIYLRLEGMVLTGEGRHHAYIPATCEQSNV